LSDNRVAIAVRDTGIGIDPSDLQQIFQEFRQVNQSLTRDKGGTGLGLAISDRLVRIMQGKIKVESQLGEGSTFQVDCQDKFLWS
jgi:signal transduction histidine kinase